MALKLMKRACPGARRFTESAVKRASRAAHSGAASARALSVALERLTYDRSAKAVTYRSDTSEGPTAGTETADPLEFLARVRVHLPDMGHVTTRYSGWYANRPRGMRRQAEPAPAEAPAAIAPALRLAPTEAARRWAKALRRRCSNSFRVTLKLAREKRSGAAGLALRMLDGVGALFTQGTDRDDRVVVSFDRQVAATATAQDLVVLDWLGDARGDFRRRLEVTDLENNHVRTREATFRVR